MIEVKTADLIGPALDWAVAKAEGWDFSKEFYRIMVQGYCPSTDWSQGGPLIAKHGITLGDPSLMNSGLWESFIGAYAQVDNLGVADLFGAYESFGDTPLIAACRALVAAKIGNTVQVPAELVTP